MKYLFAVSVLFLSGLAFASNAAPVTVSSITVAGSTVTVNSTAHGLAINQGFCLSAPAGLCNVVATSSANSFTFTQASLTACASSCGTVSVAKKVIWLQTTTIQGGYQVSYVLWLTTTQPVAGTGSSAYLSATSQEKAALLAGNFIEISRTQFFPLSTTLANAEAQLQNDFNAQQSALAASVQPGQFYGNFFDTGWTQ
jgi:hypothetical protein